MKDSEAIENAALALCPEGTDLVRARGFIPGYIKNVTMCHGLSACRTFTQGACILRGVRLDERGIELTASALFAELRQDFPNISLEEIGHAIKDGCFEKYGEVYGINAVSLYKMVSGYAHSEEYEKLARMAKFREQEQARLNSDWLAQHPDYKKSTL